MLKRFNPHDLDTAFTPAFGAEVKAGIADLSPFSATRPTPRAVIAQPATAAAPGLSRLAQAQPVSRRGPNRMTKGSLAALAAAVGLGAALNPALHAIATAPVSDTATWAMMLVGLVMIGWSARRRYQHSPFLTAGRSLQPHHRRA